MSSVSQSVLVLGSGLVSPPLIDYLSDKGYKLIIATRTVNRAKQIIQNLSNKQQSLISIIQLDIEQGESALKQLDELLGDSNQNIQLVLSLLPYTHHVPVAKLSIKHKIHFASTSYVSPEMFSLNESAVKTGVMLLNECGVDPGLDHMSAQRLIDRIHAKQGKIVGFTSICGGLPALAANNNPFQYKLSWSPRGVLLASTNTAVYLKNGEVRTVSGSDLYEPRTGYNLDFIGEGGFNELEYYPNRDSTIYREIYNIPEAQSLLRGTYRNVGWSRTMKYISKYGFTNKTIDNSLKGLTLAQFTGKVLNISSEQVNVDSVAKQLDLSINDEIITKFKWLGLFDNSLTIPSTLSSYTNLDVLCFLFEAKLQFNNGEQDAIVMKHTFDIEYSKTNREQWTSVLIHLGEQNQNKYSSMAMTVTLPVAIAIHALLQGKLSNLTGVIRPNIPILYNLILDEMEEYGVKFIEKQQSPHIIIREETKPGEERVAITPQHVKTIIESTGCTVSVEKQSTRCYSDNEYLTAGARLIESNSWPESNSSSIILGLKELPESKSALNHRHIFFAHCYKEQSGWKELLERFHRGNGVLYDLEFLADSTGRRIAAFGRPAGMVGMALGILQYSAMKYKDSPLQIPLKPWKSNSDMITACSTALHGDKPNILILGALGRCGNGSQWVCEQLGIKPDLWDLNETKAGGPFKQLNQYDVVLNAIYLSTAIPPFITMDTLIESGKQRKLSVLVDVSCDTTNPNNPFPFYNQSTTLSNPVLNIEIQDNNPLSVIAIDHLPSLIPKESSLDFGTALTPHLINFIKMNSKSSPVNSNNSKNNPVDTELASIWTRAEELFRSKTVSAGLL